MRLLHTHAHTHTNMYLLLAVTLPHHTWKQAAKAKQELLDPRVSGVPMNAEEHGQQKGGTGWRQMQVAPLF